MRSPDATDTSSVANIRRAIPTFGKDGSVRNVGHRISALFRRKKKRITKESEETNNKLNGPNNAQIHKNFGAKEARSTEHLGLDSKNKNNLSEDTITCNQFTKCSNVAKKDSNVAGEQKLTEAVQNSTKMNEGSKNDRNNSRDNIASDINKKYREMEIEVARRVRETMELADAKRKALYASNNEQRTDKVEKNIQDISQSQRISKAKEYDMARALALEGITNTEQNVKSKTETIHFETPAVNDTIQANSGEVSQNIDNTSSVNNGNLINIDEEPKPQDEKLQAFQIGFEKFENTFDEDLKQTELAENYSISNTSITNDSRFSESDDGKQWKLAEDALSLAQNAATNIENMPYEPIGGNQSELAEGALAQHVARNIDNIPCEPIDASQTEIVEGALYLAQQGARNIDSLPYKPTGVSQIEIAEGALYLAQQGTRNIDNIPYEPTVIAKNRDIDAFALTDEIGNAKHWELAEGALLLAQNAAVNVDNACYDDSFAERRQLAEGALNLAQNAARNVNYTSQDVAANNEWLLAEGALQLAQNAIKNIDIANQENAEAEKRVTNTVNQQRQKLQIGFESFENSFDDSKTD